MEWLLVAGWLVVAAILLGPPLAGVYRSKWPLRSSRMPTPQRREDAASEKTSEATGTPLGTCRVCGTDGQAGYTYCRSCLTPLPRLEGESDGEASEGQPAD